MDNTPIHGCSGCATTGGRMACSVHGQASGIYKPPVAPVTMPTVEVTQRRVPVTCEVCNGTGRRTIAPLVDVDCPACGAQGWLTVTETITRTHNAAVQA